MTGVMPSTSMLPEVALVRPEISLSNVDLPQPEGPIRLTNSPLAMVRSICCSTVDCCHSVLLTPERVNLRDLQFRLMGAANGSSSREGCSASCSTIWVERCQFHESASQGCTAVDGLRS